MRQHSQGNVAQGLVEQSALSHATVVRFVMLKSEVRSVIAEGQQKVITLIMRSAKQRDSFSDDALQRGG